MTLAATVFLTPVSNFVMRGTRVRIAHRVPFRLGAKPMTRLNRVFLFSAIVIASIWTGASTASAQSGTSSKTSTTPKSERTKVDIVLSERDSVTIADVTKAADQLAIAVQEAVRKATEDPALRVAALKVAKNAVAAAQIAITQQAETLQTVLETLAREIAVATEKQQSKSKSH